MVVRALVRVGNKIVRVVVELAVVAVAAIG
jgi:hypothetical protein